MPDLNAITNELKNVPDQALQSELQNPTGAAPSYLVLAEAQRRQLFRQAAERQVAQGQSESVYSEILRNMTARNPPQNLPPPPAGMTPVGNAPAPTPGATPPQNFNAPKPMAVAKGGVLRFADGGVNDYNDIVNDAAQEFNVNPNTLRSQIQVESRGDPNAVSPKGAIGYMQLMPDTARGLGVDPYDPVQNIRGGARLMRMLLDRYGGNTQLALAAYNAGPGAVDKYGGIPPFKETQNYVRKVVGGAGALAETPPAATAQDNQMTPTDWSTNIFNPQAAAPTPTPDQQQPSQAAPPTTSANRAAWEAVRTRLENEIAGVQTQLGQFPERLTPENIQKLQEVLPQMYGADLKTLEANALGRRAQISQLQNVLLNKYSNPDVWSYLGNLASGMANSKQLSLPMAFASGVGVAGQAREKEQQQALADYIGLQREADTIDDAFERERLGYGGAGITLLGHQLTADASRQQRLLTQLDKLQTDHDKLLQSEPVQLTPELARFAPGRKPGDVVPQKEFESIQTRAATAFEQQENRAEEILAENNIPRDLSMSARDQVLKVIPKAAGQLSGKPGTAVDPFAGIDPNILKVSDTLGEGQRNEQLLAALPEQDRQMVKLLANYKYPMPTSGFALTKPEWSRWLALTEKYDPSFDPKQYASKQKLITSFTSGKDAQTVQALNTVAQHLGRLEQNWANLNNFNGGFGVLNQPWNALRKTFHNPAFKPFEDDQRAAADELMKAWRQSGGTETEIQDWKKGFDENATPDEQRKTMNEIYGLLQGRFESLKSTFENGLGRPMDFHLLKPETQQLFTSHGLDIKDLSPGEAISPADVVPRGATPAAAPAAPAAKRYQVNGREIVPQGGRWVYKDTGAPVQ